MDPDVPDTEVPKAIDSAFDSKTAIGADDAYYFDEGDEEIPVSAFERTLIHFSFLAGYVYMLLAITGILLNAYVIARLIELAVRDYERFKHGCGLPLAAMSISDLWSLVSILAVVISGFLPHSFLSLTGHSAHCKITIYIIHTLTGFSTWCWLFISALRYIAVYHPLWHVTGSALGPRTIMIMLLVMLVLNSWLPVVVVYFPETGTCEEQALSMGADFNRMLHGMELCWSYVLPAILTLALDIKVILVRPPSFSRMAHNQSRKRNSSKELRPKISLSERSTLSDGWQQTPKKIKGFLCSFCCVRNHKMPRISIVHEDGKTNTDHPNVSSGLLNNTSTRVRTLTNSTYGHSTLSATSSLGCPKQAACAQNSWQSTCSRSAGSTRRGRQTVRRWLAITTIHLLLNAPDNVLRLMNVVGTTDNNSVSGHIFAVVVRLLYFAQFCFNAAYLSAIVYRRNVRPNRRQTTPNVTNVQLRIHPEYSRPQTRVGVRDESRRNSRRHRELLRRYSADPRATNDPNYRYHHHLQVNQPLRSVPLAPSYSSETFRSEELDMNSHSSPTPITSSPRSPSTEPRGEMIRSRCGSSEGRTSAGLLTYGSSEAQSRIQSRDDDWLYPKTSLCDTTTTQWHI